MRRWRERWAGKVVLLTIMASLPSTLPITGKALTSDVDALARKLKAEGFVAEREAMMNGLFDPTKLSVMDAAVVRQKRLNDGDGATSAAPAEWAEADASAGLAGAPK
jgi:hypothetical protein